MSQEYRKCTFPANVQIKPDGVNELDPCIYEEVETHENVTVHVMRCRCCGHVEIVWSKEAADEM